MIVTVVGAVNLGCAHAAKLFEGGHSVRLLEPSRSFHSGSFERIQQDRKIDVDDNTSGERTFSVQLDMVTREAVVLNR